MELKSLVLVGAIFLTACNGTLHIYDGNGNKVHGVPFKTSELYKKVGIHNRHSKFGEKCTRTGFVEIVALATGAPYYANAETAIFAKTAFTLKNGDSGSLSEIAFNSEPAVADTLNATNELLKTLLPAAGLVPAAAPPPPGLDPACDVGEDPASTRFIKFTPDAGSQ